MRKGRGGPPITMERHLRAVTTRGNELGRAVLAQAADAAEGRRPEEAIADVRREMTSVAGLITARGDELTGVLASSPRPSPS